MAAGEDLSGGKKKPAALRGRGVEHGEVPNSAERHVARQKEHYSYERENADNESVAANQPVPEGPGRSFTSSGTARRT